MAESGSVRPRRAAGKHRSAALAFLLPGLAAGACAGESYDFEEGRMASFGLPSVGNEQAADSCLSDSSGRGSVVFRVRDLSVSDVRDVLRQDADEDIGGFGRAFRHGEEWLLVLNDEEPVRIDAYYQGQDPLECQAE